MPLGFSDDQDQYSDDALLQMVRKRIARELEEQRGGQVVTNNVYGGGGGGPPQGGGLTEQMAQDPGGGSSSPEDYDYFVDIARENLEAGDPDPMDPERKLNREGWRKRVHRYRTPAGGDKKKVM